MQLIDWKYNQRQARLERQFQGRRWAAEHGAQIEMNPAAPLENRGNVPLQEPAIPAENQAAVSANPQYSQPGQLMISLWPLRLIAGVALCVSLFMLKKERTHVFHHAANDETEGPPAGVATASESSLPVERGVSSQ